MKNIVLILLIAATPCLLAAQQVQDVVYLKNGSIMRGEIVEKIQNDHLKIRIADGNVFTFPYADIEKITLEKKPFEGNLDDYGGRFSGGPAIGGGGLIGGVFQYHPTKMVAVEAGFFYRPIAVINYNDEIDFKNSVMMAGGAIFISASTIKQPRTKSSGTA